MAPERLERPERHTSLISLPDFGVPDDSQQMFNSALNSSDLTTITATATNFDSYLLSQKEEISARLFSTTQASIADFSTKFATGKVDLAAAFRRQMSLPSVNKQLKPSGCESVYSVTTARSELQYDPIDSAKVNRSQTLQVHPFLGYHPHSSVRETATFGTTNDIPSELNSDHYSVSSSYARPRHDAARKQPHPKPPLPHVYESSEAGETEYTRYVPRQRRRRSNSMPIKQVSRRDRNGNDRRRRHDSPRIPYNQRDGPLMHAMTTNGMPSSLAPFHPMHGGSFIHPRMIPPYHAMNNYPQTMAYPLPPVQQPGQANQHLALSPIASRSLLTCSREFQAQFPNVYSGLCKGLIDVNRLIQHEVVIPIKEEIALHKNAIRSRRAVIASVSEQLWKPLHGKFPDPAIAPKLVKKVSEYFFDKIEGGIQQAEDERSFLQWMFRFDVENAIEIRVTTSLGVGYNSAIANIEGAAHIKRRKGDCFSLLNPDTVTVDMDIVVKALFLNGGQLTEINNDPMFIDRVQAGENRFAASFINLY